MTDIEAVMEAIIKNPGIQTHEIRSKLRFSKAKITSLVKELSESGRIFRQRQGQGKNLFEAEYAAKNSIKARVEPTGLSGDDVESMAAIHTQKLFDRCSRPTSM